MEQRLRPPEGDLPQIVQLRGEPGRMFGDGTISPVFPREVEFPKRREDLLSARSVGGDTNPCFRMEW